MLILCVLCACMCAHMCMYVHTVTCDCVHVEVIGQPSGVGFLLLQCEPQGLNPGKDFSLLNCFSD